MLLVEFAPEVRTERAHTAQREAHRRRQVTHARRAQQPPRLVRTRRTVGHGLVRLGERLAGTEPQPTGRGAARAA